jgi:UDP-N-acetylmuramyl pentapeptide phosphotransferase/UDP-N-acetylglucosamine-1-phosphate transferase
MPSPAPYFLELLLFCLAVAAAVWAASGLVLRLLRRIEVYDVPNQRSSHAVAKPRGGGLAVVPLLLAAWGGVLAWLGAAPPGLWLVLGGALLLAAVSWADDLKGLSAAPRLLAQAAAVALGLWGLGDEALVFQGLLPLALDRIAAALAWIWFVNLFNFMDGIDGISVVEAGSIGAGLALAAWFAGGEVASILMPALMAAAMLGFAPWNWEPSRIFLGDVGSVPLGYLLGWLLLLAAAGGQWAVALILPLYYLADATWTLAKRGLRRERVWQAHREHFYQRAVQGGLSHAATSGRILICNLALVALALAALAGYPWPALGGAAATVAVLLWRLARHAARAS